MSPPLALAPNGLDDTGISQADVPSAPSFEALAALLFEWRVESERHLRALTSVQQWLERVRCSSSAAGERELLLQEIGRYLEGPPCSVDYERWRRVAVSYLSTVRAKQASAGRDPEDRGDC